MVPHFRLPPLIRTSSWVTILLTIVVVAGTIVVSQTRDMAHWPAAVFKTNGTSVTTAPSASSTNALAAKWLRTKGMGVMGDSNQDEYRADDDRGGEYASVTFNMIEQLVMSRGFNLGAWGTWGGQRRTGYEYNWARSGATSSSMIEHGQHTGLAAQVASGEVAFVLISIGTNDFKPGNTNRYKEIYSGQVSNNELSNEAQRAIANVTLAVDTVLGAGAEGVAVTLFPQWNLDPRYTKPFPDKAGRDRVSGVIDEVNQGLIEMGASRGIAIVDINAVGLALLANTDQAGDLDVGGVKIHMEKGDTPYYAFLNDRSGHMGTVLSGLMSNYFVIDPLRKFYRVDVELLSAAEILANAGIAAPALTATPTVAATVAPTNTQTPTAVATDTATATPTVAPSASATPVLQPTVTPAPTETETVTPDEAQSDQFYLPLLQNQ